MEGYGICFNDCFLSIIFLIIMKKMLKNIIKIPYFKFSYKHWFTTSNSDSLNSNYLMLPNFTTCAKKTYLNPMLQRKDIIKDTKNKSGVYCWINLINNKYYIGSGIKLNDRLSDYFQDWYYKERNNVIIVKAIIKYGIGNFALLILDFTEKENTLIKEQFWIDKLKPEYNILKKASNSVRRPVINIHLKVKN